MCGRRANEVLQITYLNSVVMPDDEGSDSDGDSEEDGGDNGSDGSGGNDGDA